MFTATQKAITKHNAKEVIFSEDGLSNAMCVEVQESCCGLNSYKQSKLVKTGLLAIFGAL